MADFKRGSGVERFDITFVVQYFNRPGSISEVAQSLAAFAKHGTHEVLVNIDSGVEHVSKWASALKGQSGALVVSGNIHEIRGYNRLIRAARGKMIAVLQDDDKLHPAHAWYPNAKTLLTQEKSLGMLGGYAGEIHAGPQTGRYIGGGPFKHPKLGVKFTYVTWCSMGPFLFVKTMFEKLGGFSLTYSCRGEAGIVFDHEYGLRNWDNGYSVAIFQMQMRRQIGNSGSTGTRASRSKYAERHAIFRRNKRKLDSEYRSIYDNRRRERTDRLKQVPLSRVKRVHRVASLKNLQNAAAALKYKRNLAVKKATSTTAGISRSDVEEKMLTLNGVVDTSAPENVDEGNGEEEEDVTELDVEKLSLADVPEGEISTLLSDEETSSSAEAENDVEGEGDVDVAALGDEETDSSAEGNIQEDVSLFGDDANDGKNDGNSDIEDVRRDKNAVLHRDGGGISEGGNTSDFGVPPLEVLVGSAGVIVALLWVFRRMRRRLKEGRDILNDLNRQIIVQKD